VTMPLAPGRRHARRESPATLLLRVQLEGAFPPVWRRIEVASDLGLEDLHEVLQVLMGWEDYHLHRFTTGPELEPGAVFACTADLAQGFDDDPAVPTWDVRVDELLAEPGERLHYQYDYGDNWWLTLEVEDVTGRRRVPRRVGAQLAALLLRARDSDTERLLRALASSAGGAADVEVAAAARTVRPFTVLLDIIGDGVKLTAAGYLPPAVVQTIFDELDMGDDWIGKGNREDLTVPVLELRETAQQLELLRKYKGRLVPTARGRDLASDPVGLWWHLAGALPVGGREVSEPEWHAGVLLLALIASGDTDNAEVTIATLLTGLGWAVGDGQPIDRRTVTGLIATDVRLLRQLGALERDEENRWPGAVTPDGMVLARAALTPSDG